MSHEGFKNINFADPNVFNRSANVNKVTEPTLSEKVKSTVTAAATDSKVKEPSKSTHLDMSAEDLFKHPLQNTWTLWYLENDHSNKSYEEMQNIVTSFDTVEDFWSLFHHIKAASEIKIGSDYSMFKKGIRPMWEDAANRQGGRWMITMHKNSKADLDRLWCDVLLCLIGENFDYSDQICGAVLNVRLKNNKVSIWTADGNNEESALEIGHKLREILHLPRQNLQYILHDDSMVKQGSNVKPIYTL